MTGLVVLSIGIHLINEAYIGLAPWSVFHDGLSIIFHNNFGNMTIYVGLIILLISVVLLKTKVGLGTILNILIIGNLIKIYELYMVNIDYSFMERIILFIFGFLLTTFGRSLYIASDLGQGPRDGLFVGLARVTKIDVKYIKPTIELIVLLIGILLGGNFGIGTIILVLASGFAVEKFFVLLRFDPKKKTQSNVLAYFIVNK